jgi:hypothetical protein
MVAHAMIPVGLKRRMADISPALSLVSSLRADLPLTESLV